MTDDELIERLHKHSQPQSWRHPEDKRLMAAAASRITELKAICHAWELQCGELTEALYDIRNRILCPVGPSPSLDEVEAIASAALSQGGVE